MRPYSKETDVDRVSMGKGFGSCLIALTSTEREVRRVFPAREYSIVLLRV